MRRFLVKKTGDCGSPSTPKKPKADSERLVAAREYDDRRRRGFSCVVRRVDLRQTPIPTAHRQAHRPLPVPRLPTVLLLVVVLSNRRSPCPSTICSAPPVARVTG